MFTNPSVESLVRVDKSDEEDSTPLETEEHIDIVGKPA